MVGQPPPRGREPDAASVGLDQRGADVTRQGCDLLETVDVVVPSWSSPTDAASGSRPQGGGWPTTR